MIKKNPIPSVLGCSEWKKLFQPFEKEFQTRGASLELRAGGRCFSKQALEPDRNFALLKLKCFKGKCSSASNFFLQCNHCINREPRMYHVSFGALTNRTPML